MKKPYDEGYFFEIQSLEEMHALNAYGTCQSRNVSRYWQCTRSQKASLILQKMVQRKILPVSGLVLVQIV